MSNDAIVTEIRKVRDAHVAKFNYDLDAIFQDLKAKEQSSGRRYVRYQPRPNELPQRAVPSEET